MSANAHNPFNLPQSALDECDRAAIHAPGTVQPHGVLLVLSRDPDPIVVQVSANAQSVLGIQPSELSGRPLSVHVGAETARVVAAAVEALAPRRSHLMRLSARTPAGSVPLEGLLHRHNGVAVLEVQPLRRAGETTIALDPGSVLERLRTFVLPAERSEYIGYLASAIAGEMRAFTGFDRVMIYRFDAEWHGEVIAESKVDELESYLGLRFPASDIPRPARELFRLNRVRSIADVHAAPAALLPRVNPQTGTELDMSMCRLRSCLPVCLEFYHNMGVEATLIISIVVHDKLWGLVSCHHRTPRAPTFESGALGEFIADLLSAQIAVAETFERAAIAAEKNSVLLRLVRSLTLSEDWIARLVGSDTNLLDAIEAGGAAVVHRGAVHRLGEAPPNEQILELVAWVERTAPGPLYATDALSSANPEFSSFSRLASGVIVATVARSTGTALLWFRPEQAEWVTWAGRASVPLIDPVGIHRLNPRKSFERWTIEMLGRAAPWTVPEFDVAKHLQSAIADLVMHVHRERSEARAGRRQSETMTALVSDAILTVTIDGTITSWNDAATAMLGFAHAEVIGKPISALFPLDQSLRSRSVLDDLLGGEPVIGQRESLVRRDGSLIDVSVSTAPIGGAEAPAVRGMLWVIRRARDGVRAPLED